MADVESPLVGGLAYENFVRILQSLQQDRARLAWERYRAPSIGDALAPHKSYQSNTAIVLPECNQRGRDAIVKLVPLIEEHQYQGMASENPLDHIREFEENCSMTDFPEEYVKMFLFPKSLSGKSKAWFKGLPVNSLKTWEQCRATFLNHFYTPGKTANFRNKIQNYSQRLGESFYETWERFKEFKVDCPHHGFSEEQLLLYFYDGLDCNYKGILNAASAGNFATQSVEGAYELIGNMATSSYNKDIEYDRAAREEKPAKSLRDLSDTAVRVSDKHKVKQSAAVLSIQHASEKRPYEPRGTFDEDYRNHPLLSYRNPDVANPEDQFYPPIGTSIRPNQSQFDRTTFDEPEIDLIQHEVEEWELDSLKEMVVAAVRNYQEMMAEMRFRVSALIEN